MKRDNQAQGAKAKRAGDQWEWIFEVQAKRAGIWVTAIADGARRVGRNQLIPCKQGFDYALSFQGVSAFVDTKTTTGSTFPCSKIDHDQLRELAGHAAQGQVAGYVIWTRASGALYFIPAGVLIVKAMLKRGSIGPEEPGVISLGTVQRPAIENLFKPVKLEVLIETH